MAYVDQGGQASRKTAIVGVAAIHAIIGTVLVTGLAGGTFIIKDDAPFEGRNIEVPLEPPPPPEPKDEIQQETPPRDSTIYAPDIPVRLPTNRPPVDTTPILPPPGTALVKNPTPPIIPGLGNEPIELPPLFDPIAAKPSNDVSRWVTTDDYRDSWINRGMVGTARFTVKVGTNGKVQDCRIVSSTGHQALDTATCKLVKRRAEFTAARDSNGRLVRGTYTRSIRWQLPD